LEMPICATRPPGKRARHSSAVPELSRLRLVPKDGLGEPFEAVEPALHASAAGKQRCNPHRLPYAALKASMSALVYALVVGKLGGAITVGLSHTCGHGRTER